MVDAPEFERWRADAERARDTAVLALGGESHNWACFLSEQAAQLALKGLLHGLGLDAHGHDLDALGRRAQDAGLEVEPVVQDALRRLARHPQPARYADTHVGGPAFSHYGRADAEQALADVHLVLELVDRAWLALAD